MTDTRRRCDFCEQPAESLTVRINPDDPTSQRVAVGHHDCYMAFMTILSEAHRQLTDAADAEAAQ